jgi:hypothetical protein
MEKEASEPDRTNSGIIALDLQRSHYQSLDLALRGKEKNVRTNQNAFCGKKYAEMLEYLLITGRIADYHVKDRTEWFD